MPIFSLCSSTLVTTLLNKFFLKPERPGSHAPPVANLHRWLSTTQSPDNLTCWEQPRLKEATSLWPSKQGSCPVRSAYCVPLGQSVLPLCQEPPGWINTPVRNYTEATEIQDKEPDSRDCTYWGNSKRQDLTRIWTVDFPRTWRRERDEECVAGGRSREGSTEELGLSWASQASHRGRLQGLRWDVPSASLQPQGTQRPLSPLLVSRTGAEWGKGSPTPRGPAG